MSQTETARVAADLTAGILGEAAAKFAGDEVGDNAARMLNEMQPQQAAAAPQAPAPVVSSPTPAAEPAPPAPPASEQTEEPDELPDFTPQLSDEYRALLEEPDFAEEAAAEIDAEQENEYNPDLDTDTARRIRELEKRNAWLEQQTVKANKGKWIAEAERSFPLLKAYAGDELREIQATSRRGFAREAAKLNDRMTRVLTPAIQDLQAAKQQAKTEATTEARQLAAQNWGLPPGEGIAAADQEQAAQIQSALQKAREERLPLAERLKILGGILPKR